MGTVMNLYNLRGSNRGYQITKFDEDLNPESTYTTSLSECDCPAGSRSTCRHRKMLPLMIERADSPWFYNFDTGEWHDPTGEAGAEPEFGLEEAEEPTEEEIRQALADVAKADAKRAEREAEFASVESSPATSPASSPTKPWRRV